MTDRVAGGRAEKIRAALDVGTKQRQQRWRALARHHPEFAQLAREDPSVGDHFQHLLSRTVERLGVDADSHPELFPPRLQVMAGRTFSVNACFVGTGPDRGIILFDVGLYLFMYKYIRAAATWFLPRQPDGSDPATRKVPASDLWPGACSALAVMLDWTASRAGVPLGPPFEVSPYQAERASSLITMAEVFALCHELSHLIGRELDRTKLRTVDVDGVSVVVVSVPQQEELAADAMAVPMLLSVLEKSEYPVALGGMMYLLHGLGLLESYALNIGSSPDDRSTHPSMGLRFITVRESLKQFPGGERAARNLDGLHEQLERLDKQILATALTRWDKARRGVDDAFEAACAAQADQERVRFTERLRKSLVLSPTAVTRKLESELAVLSDDSAVPTRRARLGATSALRFAVSMPPELQQLLLPPLALGIVAQALGRAGPE